MAKSYYEVTVPELTLLTSVGRTQDPVTGDIVSYQNRSRLATLGEVISEDDISPDILRVLNDSDHPSHESVSKKLKKTTKSAAKAGIGAPVEGYDEMDEEEIVQFLRNADSNTVSLVRQYERENEARPIIVNYNAGVRESDEMRSAGMVSSPAQDSEEGKTAEALVSEPNAFVAKKKSGSRSGRRKRAGGNPSTQSGKTDEED